MSETLVRVIRDGRIAFVTLNSLERRNAINAETVNQLIDVCRDFSNDEATRAIIFNAVGNDFSVGADLQGYHDTKDKPPSLMMLRRIVERGSILMEALQAIHQPTICAVQGVASGAGACIAAACDFRIAAATARMGFGEVRMGMNLAWNAVSICVGLVGSARAKRMVMTGKLFDAATLERWGFVDAVVEPELLRQTALEWAQEYAILPPIPVQMIKRSINACSAPLGKAVMHMDADQLLLTASTGDFREAVLAFFEKRQGDFLGD